MAHIRKLKNGTFQASIYVGTQIKDGKTKKVYEYVTCKREKDCKNQAREIEQDIHDGKYSHLRNIKFSKYSIEWLDIIKGSITNSTYILYETYVYKHFIPFFGLKKLKDISPFDIKKYINLKLKTLSKETVRKHFYILNKLFSDALQSKNPMIGIKPPKPSKYNPTILEEHEFALILSAVENTIDELPVLLAAWCGLRLGEIFALKWKCINNNKLYISESMSITKSGYKLGSPKTENSIRQIEIPNRVKYLLEQKRKAINFDKIVNFDQLIFSMRPDSYSKRFIKIIKTHNELLAMKLKGKDLASELKYCSSSSIKKNLKIQSENLPKIRFHDLRHYHATILFKNGIPDLYAANRLGHDIRTLKTIYQHLESTTEKKLDNKIRKIFE